jgi:hypothetical protein
MTETKRKIADVQVGERVAVRIGATFDHYAEVVRVTPTTIVTRRPKLDDSREVIWRRKDGRERGKSGGWRHWEIDMPRPEDEATSLLRTTQYQMDQAREEIGAVTPADLVRMGDRARNPIEAMRLGCKLFRADLAKIRGEAEAVQS